MSEEKQELLVSFEPHKPARPMVFVKDSEGELWLCDKEVDQKKDLRSQGCWNCGELAFTRND